MLYLESSLPVLPFASLHVASRRFTSLHVASRGVTWVFLYTHVPAIRRCFRVNSPATPLPISVEVSDLGLHAVSSEFPTPLHDGSTPLPSPVGSPASSTIVIDKLALGAIPAATPQISADGSDVGLHAVPPEFLPPLQDDSASPPRSVVTPTSSTVVLDKAALGAISLGLTVRKDSVVHQKDPGPQTPSAVSHSAS